MGKRTVDILWTGISAFAVTWAIHAYYGAPIDALTLWLAVFAMAVFVRWHAAGVTDKPIRRMALSLGSLFAVYMVLGREISTLLGISRMVGSLQAFLDRLWMGFGLALLFCALLRLAFAAALAREEGLRAPERAQYFGGGRGGFWLLWGILLLCYTPYFLGLYPGILTFDSFQQLYQAAGLQQLSNAHPLIHTGLIWACWRLGSALGGQSVGIALYSLVQMAALAACFAFTLRAMARWRVHRGVWWGVFAFFSLSPVQGVYSVLMWKDVLFAAFTLVWLVQLFDLAREPGRMLGSPLRMVCFGATLFLFCAWRNNGLLVAGLFLPFLLWMGRRHARRLLAVLGAAALCLALYRGPVFAWLGVAQGSITEALSIPMQQIARTVRDHGEELTEEEKHTIGEVLPLSELPELYHPRIADNVKNRVNQAAFSADPGRYAALWTKLMLKYPESYAVAFLCNSFGYWYPDTAAWVVTVWGIMEDNDMGLKNEPILPLFWDLREQTDIGPRSVQGVRALYSIAIMVWLEMLCAALLALKGRRELLLPVALLLMSWLTLHFSPVSSEYRYAYPLILCAPVCLGMALAARKAPRQG